MQSNLRKAICRDAFSQNITSQISATITSQLTIIAPVGYRESEKNDRGGLMSCFGAEFWRRIRVLGLALVVGLAPAAAISQSDDEAETDVTGSADHPMIGRFAGSVITGYETRDFDEFRFLTGPGAKDAPGKDLEGRLTRIAYKAPAAASVAEVARAYQIALRDKGFQVDFACELEECGGPGFSRQIDVLPIPKMIVDGFNFRYVAARTTELPTTYASVLVSENNGRVFTQIDVLEPGSLQNKIVTAEEMATSLAEAGRIALYGVYFETGSADIIQGSGPTLEQMAALLRGSPELKVAIVGHTDYAGSFDYNMDLSQRRADSVATALIQDYGIDQNRLRPAGVGYLAPVATNTTAIGRSRNRRVELVAE